VRGIVSGVLGWGSKMDWSLEDGNGVSFLGILIGGPSVEYWKDGYEMASYVAYMLSKNMGETRQ
jgi:hypothetical protein